MGLDSVELILAIEEAFALEIPDRDVRDLVTVGQLRDYVAARTGCAPEAVWPELVDIVEREGGVKRDRIVPEARIVKDLGID
jgi:hypothetical protein